jgi:hypothetical protein
MFQDNTSCTFNCSIWQKNPSNEIVADSTRVIVLHSGWSAIFDETFEINGNRIIEITLPQREYCYLLNAGVYTEDGETGTTTDYIPLCC